MEHFTKNLVECTYINTLCQTVYSRIIVDVFHCILEAVTVLKACQRQLTKGTLEWVKLLCCKL